VAVFTRDALHDSGRSLPLPADLKRHNKELRGTGVSPEVMEDRPAGGAPHWAGLTAATSAVRWWTSSQASERASAHCSVEEP
jgi:hypothetical protein